VRDAEEFRYLVLAAQREGSRLLAGALRPLGLTPAWAEAIIILDERSPLTVKELGDLLVCESDHPSRLADRMSRTGLIERIPSPSDGRAVELRLTSAARALVPQVRSIEDDVYSYLEQALPGGAMAAATAALQAAVTGLPAGDALERRKHHQATSQQRSQHHAVLA
jgi:DNA-binding MarR family transcriptional regulator